MQEKSILLTPNKRLARHLQRQFCDNNALQNLSAWHTPTILPIKTWLISCWLEFNDSRVLLTPLKEKLLWQKIIIDELGEGSLSLTNIAMEAHELINSYLIKQTDLPIHNSEDITVFQKINEKFKELCKNNNFTTNSELGSAIIPYIKEHSFKEITLAGFDEYTPQLQELINVIKSTGCKVSYFDPNNCDNSKSKKISFSKIDQEIATSAKWAKHILSKNSNNKIGIVVPNLLTLYPKISQIFYETFDDTKTINISAGIPLNSAPIINHALWLISFANHADLEALGKILSSPYILGSKEERSDRALLNQKLKEANNQFYLTNINKIAEENGYQIPKLLKIAQHLQKQTNIFLEKQFYCSEWIKTFSQLLDSIGWPGEENLSDIEISAVDKFSKLLQEIAATNFVTGKISYKRALQILQDNVINSTFQPKDEIDAPINIIGTLEAAGLNFDHLWVMGSNQQNWPPAPHPNPFISIETQKKLDLPHCSSQRELKFCKTITKRYQRSAKEVIFSYINQIEDHKVEASSLITDAKEISIDDLELTNDITTAQKIFQSKKLEQLIDNLAPKLGPKEKIHPKSKLIESQSLCPFKAFVEFRLGVKEPEESESGISRIQRGITVHTVLEKFWQKVKNQQSLLAMEPIAIENLITETINYSLDEINLPKEIQAIEKRCLTSLVKRWIELEKNRLPFQVIATEKNIQIKLSSLPINLRIDRIDQLINDGKIVIDYKTGKNLPSIFDWFGKRPKNIQLMLYSVALGSVQGIGLAQVNVENLKFKDCGLNELSFSFYKIDPDYQNKQTSASDNLITWDELIKYWRTILTNLATDFESGIATPDPLSPQVCKQCDFGSICRASQA